MSGVPGQRSGGHNRKGKASLRLAGTYRQDRHETVGSAAVDRQESSTVVPMAPAGLSAASKEIWRRIHAEYEIADVPRLELLESALRSRDTAEKARQTLEKDGLTFVDKHGQPRAHPAAAIHRDARAQYVSTLRVLGFPGEAV